MNWVAAAMLGSLSLSLPSAALAFSADEVRAMLQRIHEYFQEHEVDGVTHDPRNLKNPPEETRLSIVSQLLGYCELHRSDPAGGYDQDIVDRADHLILHFDEITSGSAFDGMLGYALLRAYEVKPDETYLAKATEIVDQCMALEDFDITLNWGLMAAMALARYAALFDRPDVLEKVSSILGSVRGYQHSNGSFPHYCVNSTDVHYTAWMAMELIVIGRDVRHHDIAPMLAGARAFLGDRIGADGITSYQEPCGPNCWIYYYSRRSGCPQDYDTRGWVNELAYNALVLDETEDPEYHAVMEFLLSLENSGTFPDKWDYRPPSWDPIYPWASSERSIIRASVIFWGLASQQGQRDPGTVRRDPRMGDVALEAMPDVEWLPRVAPHEMRDRGSLRFRLLHPHRVSLEIFDATGRRIRTLVDGALGAGDHRAEWDGRDQAGRPAPSGLYFAKLATGRDVLSARLVTIR